MEPTVCAQREKTFSFFFFANLATLRELLVQE